MEKDQPEAFVARVQDIPSRFGKQTGRTNNLVEKFYRGRNSSWLDRRIFLLSFNGSSFDVITHSLNETIEQTMRSTFPTETFLRSRRPVPVEIHRLFFSVTASNSA